LELHGFASIYNGTMSSDRHLIFTQHVIDGAWLVIIIQDGYGNLIEIINESLEPEYDIEFEMDFNICNDE
jgi:hypothetical protein